MEGATSEIGKIIQENRIRKEMGLVSFTEVGKTMPDGPGGDARKKEPLKDSKAISGGSDSKSL